MKNAIRLLLALFLVLIVSLVTYPATAASPRKTVLVLSPFQNDLVTNLIAAQALREEFGKDTELGLDVYYEYLDLNRFSDAAYQKQLFDLLTTKYKNKQVDLVVVGSEAMLKLWLAQRAEILPNTPVVFFDVTTEHLDAMALPPDVTGVSGVEDCTKTVQWALDAMPKVNEIVLVGGVGKIEQGFFDHTQKLQKDMAGKVKFTDLSGLPLTELKSRVAKLPQTSIVLYHPMFADAEGTKYRPLEVLRQLTAVSSVPVIGGFDQFIGTGIIGGRMFSIDQQARDAAQLSLRVLRGEAASSIPIQRNNSDRFIFDHLALQRFNIPLSALPPDSIIKNRQYSFWELYRPQIIAIGAGITALLLLVIFLLGLTRQLSHTRHALASLNVNLESQVQERTRSLSQINTRLQDEIGERKRLENQLRQQATTDELTGITNRRHFLELAQQELKRAARFNHPLALALLDIDQFKQLNDKYGHAVGDRALKHLTTICLKNIREIDIFARFGGDEFVLLLPETNEKQAHEIVERMRLALTAQPLQLDDTPIALTLSAGLSSLNAQATLESLLNRADQALYRAKETGRNRTIVFALSKSS